MSFFIIQETNATNTSVGMSMRGWREDKEEDGGTQGWMRLRAEHVSMTVLDGRTGGCQATTKTSACTVVYPTDAF